MILLAALTAGAGIWLLVTGWRRAHPDTVTQALAGHPLEPTRADAVDRVLTWWDDTVGRRRRRSALAVLRVSVGRHRRRQVTAAAAAASGGVLLVVGGGWHWTPWALAAVPVALAGVDADLYRRAQAARSRMGAQVVHAGEAMALCATAGLTAAEAVQRCSAHVAPPLGPWLGDVGAQVRSGRSLRQALTDVREVLAVPGFDRLTEAVLTSSDHGTPLGRVLVAQADDLREQDRARRMEGAGRAEVAMLLPIVVLVLPAVVAVAAYPGFVALSRM